MGKLIYHHSILFSLLNGTTNKNRYGVEGYLLNENGTFYSQWPFSSNITVDDTYRVAELENSYLLLIDQIDEFSWRIRSSKLEDYTTYGKNSKFVISIFVDLIYTKIFLLFL